MPDYPTLPPVPRALLRVWDGEDAHFYTVPPDHPIVTARRGERFLHHGLDLVIGDREWGCEGDRTYLLIFAGPS